jgi:exosortase/archaeosortase family protein
MKIEKNTKKIILRFTLFLALFFCIRFILNSFFASTSFYQELVISDMYKPIRSNTIALVGLLLVTGFFLLNRQTLKDWKITKFRWSQAILYFFLAIISIGGYYALRYWIKHNVTAAAGNKIMLIILLYIGIMTFPILLLLATFQFDTLRKLLSTHIKEIPYYVLSGTFIYFALVSIENLWIYFSSGIARMLQFIFRIFYDNVTLSFRPEGPVLRVESFGALIGAPCSGIDSFFLFTGLYAFVFLLDYTKLNKTRMLLLFPIGAIGMYLINLIRIFLLFLTGIYINPKFAVGLFHQNIGWILFILYFVFFWWIISKRVYAPSKNSKMKKNNKVSPVKNK